MATTGTLTYLSENYNFRYENGDYVITGNKVMVSDSITSVDGGSIMKNDAYIGNFYIRFMEGDTILSINEVKLSEFDNAKAAILDLLAAFAAE